MRFARPALVAALAGCSAGAHDPRSTGEVARAPGAPAAVRPGSTALTVEREVVFEGMCDASGAVELDARTFMVADDEDNLLRIYDALRGGPPLAALDVSRAVGLEPRGKKQPRMPELDLEAATRLGDRAYWITSHGRNSAGRPRPERLRLFATTLPGPGHRIEDVQVLGATDRLLEALVTDPRYAALGLAEAATRAPKDEGGFNLEGMTAAPDGSLLLGLRNPVPDGQAILFTLTAPAEALTGTPTLGAPVRLALGGLGVRALTWWRGGYVIVAGPRADGEGARLYTWDGAGPAREVAAALAGYNPEGTFSPDGDRLLLLSDDGTRALAGQPCKELPDHDQRRFRGVWLRADG